MGTWPDQTLATVFAVACVLLLLKAQILGAATAATRGRLKKFINPEDARWLAVFILFDFASHPFGNFETRIDPAPL